MGFFMGMKYKGGTGSLAPGLILPADYERELRKYLVTIEDAATITNCLLATERLIGAIDGLAIAGALPADALERLYLLADKASAERIFELQ
jgi:hypothetical protein